VSATVINEKSWLSCMQGKLWCSACITLSVLCLVAIVWLRLVIMDRDVMEPAKIHVCRMWTSDLDLSCNQN